MLVFVLGLGLESPTHPRVEVRLVARRVAQQLQAALRLASLQRDAREAERRTQPQLGHRAPRAAAAAARRIPPAGAAPRARATGWPAPVQGGAEAARGGHGEVHAQLGKPAAARAATRAAAASPPSNARGEAHAEALGEVQQGVGVLANPNPHPHPKP